MKAFHNYSVVTAILPRQSTGKVLKEVLASGGAHAMSTNARGSLIKDSWFKSLLPSLSPEQELLHFLAPDDEINHLMEQIVMVGKLQLYGAGSIYAMPCEQLSCSDDYPLWESGNYTFESVSFDIEFREDLTAIIHVTDRDSADAICRAAIHAGAPGPTVSYIRGFGLRDRLGLLRITKQHDKERITVVVDEYDREAVFQAMAQAGNVDQPGRGLLYQVPISRGLTNLASVFQARKHSASIQQIVRVIDDMQGNTDWRANQLLIHDPRAEEFQEETRGITKDLMMLNVFCHRKDTDELLFCALDFGAPGASVTYWRFAEAEAEQTRGGLRLNREFGRISFLLSEEKVGPLRDHLQQRMEEKEMKQTLFFCQRIPLARSFTSLK